MESQLNVVLGLQDLYASESGLSVLLTNERGEWLTRPSGMTASFERGLGPLKGRLETCLQTIVQGYAAARQGIVCDVAPGVRLLMAPVNMSKRQTYYIWAGCLVDEQAMSRSQGQPDAEEEPFPWLKVWPSVPLGSEAHTEQAVAQIGRLASVAEGLLRSKQEEQRFYRRAELLRKLSAGVGSPEEWMDALADATDKVDFVGFAKKTEGQQFTIGHYTGPGTEGIRGLSFSLGEGFVGQVATARKAAFWDRVDRDPRTFIFAERGLCPTALFCVPVMRERELFGVLFGGSVTERTLGKGIQSWVQAFAAHWTMQITLSAVRQDRDTNFTRLSTFVETCGSINQAQDAKRLSFILIDMSLNLVEGAFSCVVLKQSASKVQLVSRGIGQQQAERYVKEVAARWSSRRGGGTAAPAADLYESASLPPVLECSLFYQNELLGVWCIALKEAGQYALYREYMTIVAQAAATVLYRLWDKGRVERGDAVQLLNRALGYWDSYAYQMTHEAQELALPFARALKLPDSDIKHIGEACLIYPYSPSFLGNDLLPSPEQMQLIEDFHSIIALLEENKPRTAAPLYGIGGQIIAMIYFYLQFNRDLQALDQLWAVSAELRQSFRVFCDSREVVDTEISLGEEAEPASSREALGSELPDIRKLRELPPLSTREQEVLGQVLEGKSNREIAEKLIISEHTVKNHMTNIFHKLGVTDRAQAIALVYKAGWNQ
ncbi:LuxR C-terminal-related transcriptional regulator [Paenibacillus hodogayensis]|uniref:LuxR C-terminal-related transcriptional regulator n=1 Tax=Paenibacillus hodogayensis TaxID=279208 RepID=A0ABV5W6H2_9BACL